MSGDVYLERQAWFDAAPAERWQDEHGLYFHGEDGRRVRMTRASASPDTRAGDNVVNLPASAFFGDKGGLIVPRLGSVIRDAGHLQVGIDGRLYRYEGGVYRPDGDVWSRARTRELLGDRWQKKHGEEVGAWLRAFEPTVGDRPPARWVNVANGLLDWHTSTLHPHDPDVLSTVQIPVRWNPTAACPAIDRFLAQVLPDDAVPLVEEIAGYAIYSGNPLRRAVLLVGPGRNGKSVLLGVLKALIGPENTSAVPLQVLAENRFAAAELVGKLANISGDLDARAVRQTDHFKMATGGDALTAERKYGQAFTFTPFATFLFAANEAPISSDQSEAWFDRWVVIPLDRRIPEDQVDPGLLDKLTSPAELEGLLVRAVAGLQRLMARGHFALPASVQAAGETYRERLDTVRAFVADCCTIHPEQWVPRPGLYKQYRNWCVDSGRLPLAAVNFNDRLRNDHPHHVSETIRRGIRGWQGIGLAETEGFAT